MWANMYHIEIWHVLHHRRFSSLQRQFSSARHTRVSEAGKGPLWRQRLCWHADPLWPGLRSLCVPPPLLIVSLPVPLVPHIHGFHSPSVEVEPPALFSVSSLCAFVHCFPSSRLACPAVEKYRDYGPVVMSPRLTLLFSGPVDEE